MRAFLWMAFAVACSSGERPAPAPATSPPSAAPGASGASGASAAPAPGCTVDGDCELVNGQPPACCSRCDSVAMPTAEAARVRAECAKPRGGDYFERCPHLDCACVRETARCDAGTCVVDKKPCT